MPIGQCARCASPLVEYSSVVEFFGEMYCCRNCLVARLGGHSAIVPDLPLCDHCSCPLVEPRTLIERQGHRFCCYNCAVAETYAARLVAA